MNVAGPVKNFITKKAPEAIKVAAKETKDFAIAHKKEIGIGAGALAAGFAAGELHHHVGHKLDKNV